MADTDADADRTNAEADSFGRLPDEIIGRIISLLPWIEASKTRSLSTRWNKVFTNSMPNLNLNLDDGIRYTGGSDGRRFMNMVDRLLFIRTGFVDSMKIKCRGYIDPYRLNSWIVYALGNQVKELDLWLGIIYNCDADDNTLYQLPVGIFTCNTLEALRLFTVTHFVSLKLPANISCFPKLKCLHLCELKILLSDDDSIQRLFSSCLVLEELVVDQCFFQYTTATRCKFNVFNHTLKRLTINSIQGLDEDHVVTIEAPSLVYFKFGYQPTARWFMLTNRNTSLVHVSRLVLKNPNSDLVQVHINAQSLHYLSGNFVEVLSHSHSQGSASTSATASDNLITNLPKLTDLNLSIETKLEVDMFDMWERVLSDLLACFPCLQTLDLTVQFHAMKFRRIRVTMLPMPSKSFPSSLWSQLKTVQLLSFRGEDDELQMAKYFLKNAEALEELTVRLQKWDVRYKKSKITRKLLRFPKISKNCKILVA